MSNSFNEAIIYRIQSDPQSEYTLATTFFQHNQSADTTAFMESMARFIGTGNLNCVTCQLNTDKTITVNGITVTYTMVAEYLKAIAIQEKEAL